VPPPRRILLVSDNGAPAAQTASALRRAIADRAGWKLRILCGMPNRDLLSALADWGPDGILSVFPRLPPGFLPGVPVVQLRKGPGAVVVAFDEQAIGKLAAEVLVATGCPSLATLRFTTESRGWMTGRREGFLRRARELGREPRIIPITLPANDDSLAAFVQGLRQLPKGPWAIFAGNDTFATWMLEACDHLGLQVPQDIAILGADDTPEAADQRVPLSSLRLPHAGLGTTGLAALESLWAGTPFRALTKLQPDGLVERTSTRRQATADPAVAAALRFINAHTDRAVGLDEVAAAAGVSRSTLALRFRATVGRTVKDEIDQARVTQAIEQLVSGRYTVTDVALAIGCSDSGHFTRMFRRVTGRTPRSYLP